MKKSFALLSFIGIGIFIYITGNEVFSGRRKFDFWMKFFFTTLAWVILLFILPLTLVNAFVVPVIPKASIAEKVMGIAMLFYLYAAGVFICLKQIELRNNDGMNPQ